MGAFEDFVNANLGIRKPLITDAGPPSGSSKAAGIVGTQYLDSSANTLYEKTGENNTVDWAEICTLGDPRGMGNMSGGLNIEVSGHNHDFQIQTPTHISGHNYTFDHSGVIGTGSEVGFSVDDSGHVGVNITGSTFKFHVAGSTCISGGNLYFNYNALPKSDPNSRGRVWISGSHYLMISSG